MTITIETVPRTKKNHGRIMRFGKFNKIMPSAAFMAFQADAMPKLKAAWAGRDPIDTPVNLAAVFYRDALRGDAVGYYQAIADVLQKAGVVVDDELIKQWDGSRLFKDKDRPRIEMTFTSIVHQETK